MLEYFLVTGDYDTIEREVDECLEKGWVLQGGVSVLRYETDGLSYWTFAQAMVRERPEEKDGPETPAG